MVLSIMVSSDMMDARKKVDTKDEVILNNDEMFEQSSVFFGKFIWT